MGQDSERVAVTGRCVIDAGTGSHIWHLELVGSRKALCGMRIVYPRTREFGDSYSADERPCRKCAGTPEWRRQLMSAIAATRGETPER